MSDQIPMPANEEQAVGVCDALSRFCLACRAVVKRTVFPLDTASSSLLRAESCSELLCSVNGETAARSNSWRDGSGAPLVMLAIARRRGRAYANPPSKRPSAMDSADVDTGTIQQVTPVTMEAARASISGHEGVPLYGACNLHGSGWAFS